VAVESTGTLHQKRVAELDDNPPSQVATLPE
jgi:hypothetical protein